MLSKKEMIRKLMDEKSKFFVYKIGDKYRIERFPGNPARSTKFGVITGVADDQFEVNFCKEFESKFANDYWVEYWDYNRVDSIILDRPEDKRGSVRR